MTPRGFDRTIARVALLATLLAIGGCATCASSRWAQTGPVVPSAAPGAIHLGTIEPVLAPVEPWRPVVPPPPSATP
jgi:hypothetical protein